MDEKLIALHMRTLKCTREEAIQLIQDDKAVDKGLPLPWDLTPEQAKNARKARSAGTRKVSPAKPRERKENAVKRALIGALESALKACEGCEGVTVSNPERVIDFIGADGIAYTITLTAHRAKK